MKMFIFTSSISGEVSNVTVFTSSLARAYALVYKYFRRNRYKGDPQWLAI